MNASRSLEGTGRLTTYLPSRFEITFDAKAIAGSAGEAAAGGLVAFNLYSANVVSWNVVMDLKGELRQVAPARSVDAKGVVHYCGFKNYDEDTLLVVSSENYTASGHAYKWNWKNDTYTRIGGHETLFGCHDIQWSSIEGADAFWIPQAEWQCHYNTNVTLVDATDGSVMRNVNTGYDGCVADVNHAQLLKNDTAALLSLRAIDAVAKYNLQPGGGDELVWIIGGKYGQWPIHDLVNNVTYAPGEVAWAGQHNA